MFARFSDPFWRKLECPFFGQLTHIFDRQHVSFNCQHLLFSATRTFPEPYYASPTHAPSLSPLSPIFHHFLVIFQPFSNVFSRFHIPLTYDIHIRLITPISAHSWPFLTHWMRNHPLLAVFGTTHISRTRRTRFTAVSSCRHPSPTVFKHKHTFLSPPLIFRSFSLI